MATGYATVGDWRLVTSKGKTRLTGTLVTAERATAFVAWSPDTVITGEPRDIALGDMVAWRGDLGEYNGEPQITLDKIRLARPSDGVNIGDLLPEDPDGAPDMGALTSFLATDEGLALWDWAVALPRFDTHPAAKSVHHWFIGGLRRHVHTMCTAAMDLVWGAYRQFPINPEVVMLGILYHDLGKLAELSEVPGADWETTGYLEGHLALSYRLWHKACDGCDAPDGLRASVSHVILSHHGSKEHGSPVIPRTPEAILVSALDKLDANLEALVEGVESGDQADVWALGGKVYREAPPANSLRLAMSPPRLPSARGREVNASGSSTPD